MLRLLACLFVLCLLSGAVPTFAIQTGEQGRPYVQSFDEKDYAAATQNWAIVQDPRGLMYIGNTDGVLEYDGLSWRLIRTANNSVARSLAVAATGTVYVGAKREIGFLMPDSTGLTRYVSLLDQLPLEEQDFADVWQTLATDTGIYFLTSSALFRWSSGQMRVWRPETRFHTAFAAGGEVYVRAWDVGLLRMEGDALVPVPGTRRFADERIYVMLPLDDGGDLLVGTRTQGLFRFDGTRFTRFATEADAFLLANQLYHGARLPDGTFALATRRGGVAVIDPRGRLLQVIDKAAGLEDEIVNYAYVDRQGGLWLGLEKGLARVEAQHPLSWFGEADGLVGDIQAIQRHAGQLYVATMVGVFRLVPAAAGQGRPAFAPVAGINRESFALHSAGATLLAATLDGIYAITGGQATLVHSARAFSLHAAQSDPALVYAGLADGLAQLRYDSQRRRWRHAGDVEGVGGGEVRHMVEQADGTLWLSLSPLGVLQVRPSAASSGPPDVRAYGHEHGLPVGYTPPFEVDGAAVFASNDGLFRFVAEENRFAPDDRVLLPPALKGQGVSRLRQDQQGDVWMYVGGKNGVARRQPDGTFRWEVTPLYRLPEAGTYAFFPEAGPQTPVLWLGGTDGLVRYERGSGLPAPAPYQALIRRVQADSLLVYGGTTPSTSARPTLAYAHNALRFAYAAPAYVAVPRNRYRSYLEDFDAGWSPWTHETLRDYTNLPGGDYTFHVQARDVYGRESVPGTFAFSILPPWYRSWWAYTLYGLLGALLLFGVSRLQRARVLHKERQRAAFREAELRAQAAEAQAKALQAENERKELELNKARELEHAYEELDEAHQNLKTTQAQLVQQEKLASLGQLTAGIAHEIKNPLNFINNFADLNGELAEELAEVLIPYLPKLPPEEMQDVQDILRALQGNAEKINLHGKRADNIVRSMMQHANGSSGAHLPVDLNTTLEEYVGLAYHGMRANTADFHALIMQEYDPQIGKVNFILQEMGRVLINLFQNAFHALEQRRRVSDASYEPTLWISSHHQGDTVAIRVRDNGSGIPPAIQDRIFEPFYTTKPTGEGTGLGLSLSYDIITNVHGGTLAVESTPGEGTTFIITLPLTPPPPPGKNE